ncbi:cellular communication network factor 1, like 2 [Esox lucius]|uniref:Cellular communication network factor 1, like 2 n=1 Tax=Esox lucius TaxID=8010 RepID=A0A3P8X802_ESOLU|nr:cellular communication network factor 1, like 2 [Esox lucius]
MDNFGMFSLVCLRQWFVSTLLVLLSSTAVMAEGDCPAQCSCGPSPPSCPAGISWVTDACGCCKVCARQLNQDCGPRQPCDHIKGLHCHLGAGGDPERGLCQAEAQGRPCEFSGRVYQHGEDFRPSCQYQCSCMDGVVGCMPLCPHQVHLPDWRCSQPRLARAPGRCCDQWVCDDDNHIGENPEEPPRAVLTDAQPLPNRIDNRLQPQPRAPPSDGVSFREGVSLPESQVLLSSRCVPQTTHWTECSTTCGMGISSLISNDNAECRLLRKTRLCQVRQCEPPLAPTIKKGKKCQRTVRPGKPIRINFAGCSTTQRYRPRACGSCADGRCCVPSLSRTLRLHFYCPDGESFTRNVMWIQRCSCKKSCRDYNSSLWPPVSLHLDMHTFNH